MNTTTNTRGVSEAMHTPEQTRAAFEDQMRSVWWGDSFHAERHPKAPDEYLKAPEQMAWMGWQAANAYAATLRHAPAQGGVDEGASCDAWIDARTTDSEADAFIEGARQMKAALSAPEPAAQGEAVAEFYGYIDGEPTLRWIGAPRPVGTKLYTAPPAQPAAPYFPDANALADWLESLHECHTGGAVGNRKWEAAQIAAKAVRASEGVKGVEG